MKLETDRLVLRRPLLRDVKDQVEGLNNLNVTRNLSSVPYPYTKEMGREWILKCQEEWKEKAKENKYSFFIELKDEKKMIGVLSLSVKEKDNVAVTGSWLNERYHRKGYMTEAKLAVNDFAFYKLKVRKMETEAFKENMPSNKTQLGVGYKYEGCRKQNSFSIATSEIHDVNLYGLLEVEWREHSPGLRKRLEEKLKKL